MSSIGMSGISGYDFSGLVDNLVSIYRKPADKLIADKVQLQTTKDTWRDVNTRVKALYDTLSNLSLPTTWSATKAVSSNSSITAVSGSGAVKGTYAIHVDSIARAQTVSSAKIAVADPTSATALLGGTFNIAVGAVNADIPVTAGQSLQDIAKSINDAELGVSASVVQVNDGFGVGYKLAITAEKTGIANKATFTEVSGTSLTELGIVDGGGVLNETTSASDARITVNGVTDITSATNTFASAIQGVTLTVSKEDINPTDTTTVTVDKDFSVPQKRIQAFIDQYNSVMSFIADKTSYNKDLKTTGELFGDPILQGIQSRLRTMVTTKLNNPTGPYSILADVGIGTSKDNFGKDAKLSFDTALFTKSMNENPDSVAHLFGADTNGVTLSKTVGSEEGLANLLHNYLDPMVKYGGSFETQQTRYEKRLSALNKQILSYEDRVEAYKETQTLKFARLETLLSNLQNQQNSLTNLLSSMESQTTKK